MKYDSKECLRGLRRLKLHRGFAPGSANTGKAPEPMADGEVEDPALLSAALDLCTKPSLDLMRAALKASVPAEGDAAAASEEGGAAAGVDGAKATAERAAYAEKALGGLEELGTKYGEPLMVIAALMLCEEAIQDAAEDARRLKRRSDRFVDLLRDYVFKSEHVGMEWAKVKAMIAKRSAYVDLKSDNVREPIFVKYMAAFTEKKSRKRAGGGEDERDSKRRR